MSHQDFKKHIRIFGAMLGYVFYTQPVFAAHAPVNPNNPSPLVILSIIKGIFNVVILSAGVFLVAMILMSAYKYAMAQGDPKGLAGAKSSLMYAVIGFFVVVSTYLILNIITGALGVSSNYAAPGIFGAFGQAFVDFLKLGDVTNIGNVADY